MDPCAQDLPRGARAAPFASSSQSGLAISGNIAAEADIPYQSHHPRSRLDINPSSEDKAKGLKADTLKLIPQKTTHKKWNIPKGRSIRASHDCAYPAPAGVAHPEGSVTQEGTARGNLLPPPQGSNKLQSPPQRDQPAPNTSAGSLPFAKLQNSWTHHQSPILSEHHHLLKRLKNNEEKISKEMKPTLNQTNFETSVLWGSDLFWRSFRQASCDTWETRIKLFLPSLRIGSYEGFELRVTFISSGLPLMLIGTIWGHRDSVHNNTKLIATVTQRTNVLISYFWKELRPLLRSLGLGMIGESAEQPGLQRQSCRKQGTFKENRWIPRPFRIRTLSEIEEILLRIAGRRKHHAETEHQFRHHYMINGKQKKTAH